MLKTKQFSEYFIAFLESKLNLEHFQKKVEPFSFRISEIIYSEKRDY